MLPNFQPGSGFPKKKGKCTKNEKLSWNFDFFHKKKALRIQKITKNTLWVQCGKFRIWKWFEYLIISNLCFKWIKQIQTKWLTGCHKLLDSLVEEVRNLDIFASTANSLAGWAYEQAIATWFNCSRGMGYCERRRCFVQSVLHTSTVPSLPPPPSHPVVG